MVDFLKSVKEPSVRTRAMLGASLNHRQLIQYERLMESTELIQMTDEGRWVATEKGKHFVQLYEEIILSLKPMVSPLSTPITIPSPLLPRIEASPSTS